MTTYHRKRAEDEVMSQPTPPPDLIISEDEYYMTKALELAKSAAEDGEVPVGCIIIRKGTIISCGTNGREGEKNALSHAEISAINNACKALGGWRLTGCTLYVTLEPCLMCAGAIINSRISRVVYAAKDPKAGAIHSVISLNSYPMPHPEVTHLESFRDSSVTLLRDFFTARRGK